MGNTVSRRFVFVKMKRKPSSLKPRPPARDDEELVGGPAKPMRAFAPPNLMVHKRKSPWPLIAAATGGIVAVAGAIALLASLANRPMSVDASPEISRSGMPTHPGYSRSASGGGYPSSGGGSTGASPNRPAATAQGFLASPFAKHKPSKCEVQVDGSKESLRDFSRCLEQANEKDTTPAGR